MPSVMFLMRASLAQVAYPLLRKLLVRGPPSPLHPVNIIQQAPIVAFVHDSATDLYHVVYESKRHRFHCACILLTRHCEHIETLKQFLHIPSFSTSSISSGTPTVVHRQCHCPKCISYRVIPVDHRKHLAPYPPVFLTDLKPTPPVCECKSVCYPVTCDVHAFVEHCAKEVPMQMEQPNTVSLPHALCEPPQPSASRPSPAAASSSDEVDLPSVPSMRLGS